MILRITQYGEPILRKKGRKVTQFDEELKRFAQDMIETMHDADGIGLAAQQVGDDRQICIVDVCPSPAQLDFSYSYDGKTVPLDIIMPLVVINPEIKAISDEESSYEEGCLSFPDIHGEVYRPEEISVKFQDLQGMSHEMTCGGLLSKCFQHEYDHLHGVLYIDRMEKSALSSIQMEINRLKKETKAWMRSQKSQNKLI